MFWTFLMQEETGMKIKSVGRDGDCGGPIDNLSCLASSAKKSYLILKSMEKDTNSCSYCALYKILHPSDIFCTSLSIKNLCFVTLSAVVNTLLVVKIHFSPC